jgi:hypothetical protein
MSACGGDVVGTWEYKEVCTGDIDQQIQQFCPSAMVTQTDAFTGTVTFNGDMTYTRVLSGSATADAEIPSACLMTPLGTVECSQAGGLIEQFVDGATATCTEDMTTQICTCNIVLDVDEDNAGTYTLDGGTLTTDDGSAQREWFYCVEGSTFQAREKGQMAAEGFFTQVYEKMP